MFAAETGGVLFHNYASNAWLQKTERARDLSQSDLRSIFLKAEDYDDMRRICLEQNKVYTQLSQVPDADGEAWHMLRVVRTFDPEEGGPRARNGAGTQLINRGSMSIAVPIAVLSLTLQGTG